MPKLSPESIKKCDNDGRNAFFWVCENNSEKVLEVIFFNSPIINWDFNAKDAEGDTGFIIACILNNEEAVDLILANYQRLKIDLKIRPWCPTMEEYGETGMGYWPEKFKGMTIEDV